MPRDACGQLGALNLESLHSHIGGGAASAPPIRWPERTGGAALLDGVCDLEYVLFAKAREPALS